MLATARFMTRTGGWLIDADYCNTWLAEDQE